MMAEIRGLRQRLQDDPRDHQALVRLGNLYQDVSMFDQAIEHYHKAVDGVGLLLLALLYLHTDTPPELMGFGF